MAFEDKYKEWLEKKKNQNTNKVSNPFDKKHLEWEVRNYGEDIAKSIYDRTNALIKNNANLIADSNNRYSKRKGTYEDEYVSDSANWLGEVSSRITSLTEERKSIRAYMDKYADYFNEEFVKSIYDALDKSDKLEDGSSFYQSILKTAQQDRDYWGNFTDRDSYYAWATKEKNYYEKWGKLAEEQDFKQYSDMGASIENPTFDDANVDWKFLWWEEDTTPVKNIVTYSRDNYDAIVGVINPDNGNAGVAQSLKDTQGNPLYIHMTEDEVSIYNYLLAKSGKESAQAFLDELEEELNFRQGGQVANRIKAMKPGIGKALTYGLWSISGGVDQFMSGMQQAFSSDKLPTTSTTVTNQLLGESLDGFAKYAYQAGNVVGNMLPSIALSFVSGGAGSVVGAASMGISASGNAYGQALAEGYDKGQARLYSIFVGASEAALQYAIGGISKLGGKFSVNKVVGKVSQIDNALLRLAAKYGASIGSEIVEEEAQLWLEPLFKTIILGEEYDMPTINEMLETALVTAMSTGVLEGGSLVAGVSQNNANKKIYGSSQGELVNEAIELNPSNKYAQKMQNRLDKGKKLTGNQIANLINQNETALYSQDEAKIETAITQRLTELGETENIAELSKVLTKQASGKELSKGEKALIGKSKYGQRVANELNKDNIKSGGYASEWAQKIDTDRINYEEYSSLLGQAEINAPEGKIKPITVNTDKDEEEISNAPEVEKAEIGKVDDVTYDNVEDTTESNESKPTIEEVSKKYGEQAGAMAHTILPNQDVEKYDAAYEQVFNYGRSGTMRLEGVKKLESVSYLTENQIELAYATGEYAAQQEVDRLETINKGLINGKKGHKEGVVRGDGVSIDDLKTHFKDSNNTVYKVLSGIAGGTGVDIVLYKSQANADGKFTEAQGKYNRNEAGTIYLDLNAGLKDLRDVGELANYTILRTFSHEFVHFIEKWNPKWYNELRKAVFDRLAEKGEDIDALIQNEMEEGNLSYDKASREVVAQAMTDVLPDSKFVNDLAENHKTLFEKLFEKLKEFVASIKAYFAKINKNLPKEARAMQQQVGEIVSYVINIVELFDKAAKGAVENYQMTIAVDEVVESQENIGEHQVKIQESKENFRNLKKSPKLETARKALLKLAMGKDNARESMRGACVINGKQYISDGIFAVRYNDIMQDLTEVSADTYPKLDTIFDANSTTDSNKRIEDIDLNDIRALVPSKKAEWMQNLIQIGNNTQYQIALVSKIMDSLENPQVYLTKDDGTSFLYIKGENGDAILCPVRVQGERAKPVYKVGYAKDVKAETKVEEKATTEKKSVVEKTESKTEKVTLEGKKDITDFKTAEEKAFFKTLPTHIKDYFDRKRTHPNHIIFERIGDFYEMFFDDAKTVSEVLDLTLTSRMVGGERIPMAGIPFHATDNYVSELNDKGYNVIVVGDRAIRYDANLDKKEKKEINDGTENGRSVDDSTVSKSTSDGERDTRLLEELEERPIQRVGDGGRTVSTSDDGRVETRRDDNRVDAGRTSGRPSEGDSESGDLRLRERGRDGRVGRGRDGRALGVDEGDISRGGRIKELDTDIEGRRRLTEEEATKKAEELHNEVVKQIAEKSTEKPKGRDFVIGDSLDLPNGEKARYKANIEAIKLVKQLEKEGRYATEAEQQILSKYVGWGGLANAFDQRKPDWAKEYTELKELLTEEEYNLARGSTLNAHYTDISVIKAMYDGLAKLGFNGGRMLEPSSGVGNFVGAMPTEMSAKVKSWTMVELDGITGLIAKYLYPNADVRIQGFEKANIPDNYMDVAISNVPFGNYAINDKAYPKKVTSAIHNYFFAKSLDKVRPGGIVMFITSSFTMNSSDSTVRRYIMKHADLLGAIRLPNTAFKSNAGTEVVTDILILKKREPGTEYSGVDFLESTYQRLDGWNGDYINNYFTAHPEMALGTPSLEGSMYHGKSLTYKPFTDKGSLADQIREAFTHIDGKIDYPAQPTKERTNFAVEKATKETKENGLVVKDGKVYQNKNGELIEKQVEKSVVERIKGLLEIRDSARNLLNYQQQGVKESEISKERQNLNKLYDAFVKKYGFINSQANRKALKDDPDQFSILALENYDTEKKKATKSDIFTINTVAPNRTITSVQDVSEGLIVSINETGAVDVSMIARLTSKSETDVARELIESRQVFKNRNGELETAEVYLSGNVRAKLRDAEALVPIDEDYKHNVEALKDIVPKDVSYSEIFVTPGTPWIPNNVYSDFAAYMLDSYNTEYRQAVEVRRNETGNYTVELRLGSLKWNSANTQKWGTEKRSFIDLFDAMLNSRSVVVRRTLADGKTTEIDRDATAAANEKIESITKEFQEWLWKDENRQKELETLYNETFNSIVTPKYNGDNLTVNGANANKPLRPHQRNAVQRVISSGGNTLLAHKVGAGKTYEMAAAAMKLKQLGLVNKPLFVVPKSLVAQWGVEFKDFFPMAKLLVADEKDFSTANRKIYANRIANGNYDAVIVSYEQFEKLPISNDFELDLHQKEIATIIAAIEEAKAEGKGRSLSVKDLEKKRKSLQTKIDKLKDKPKDADNIEFEKLGVDSLFVDEAHNFKNLFYTTSMTNISGLGNKDGSKRAFDLYAKVRYLQKLNGGKGIVFATATPVMNSMSEMYIMQKYLQPDLLNQLGLNTFDAWAKQFGEVVNGVEIKPSGQGYRVKQSFSRFKNMSELQLLFRNFADVLTDIPGLKIPKTKGGKVNVVECESGQFQKDFMQELEKRADNVKNVDASVDNMLKITSDGRKISYTQRMIDPSLPYEETCKIYKCADNTVRIYNENKANKGTQLIFCDMATPKGKSKTENADAEMDMENARLYDDIKARLVQKGIPAKEIAFIHDADTDQKKKKLFVDVNEGRVRVLIGSTGKMGVGMNAQKRVVAIHHLDAPWRPGDVEQRNGRAFRQGNINEEVECLTYVTVGSFDARLWDILDRKSGFINQIMNGDNVGREVEDTGEVTLSAAEVKALASGSPLIMEQVQLDTEIKKLESLYRAHLKALTNAKARLSQDQIALANLSNKIEACKGDLAIRVDTYSEGKFSITIGNRKYTDKKEAGVALVEEAKAKANRETYTTIGKFAGFELRVIKTAEGINGMLVGKQGYPFNTYPTNTTYGITHLISLVDGLSSKIETWQNTANDILKDLDEQEKLIKEPFAKQTELDEKRKRYNEIMEILNPKEEQKLESIDDDSGETQYQRRGYSKKKFSFQYGIFPTENESGSEANRLAIWWANKPDTETGEQTLISMHDTWYVCERFDDSTHNYQVVDRITEQEFNKIFKEIKENGRYGKIQSIQTAFANYDKFDKLGDTINTTKSSIDSMATQHSGEDTQILRLDREESSRWETSSNGKADSTSIFKGEQGIENQEQRRDTALTDREILDLAANELVIDDLTEAEQSALEIFKNRLTALNDLYEERVKLGKAYVIQQFSKKEDGGNRQEAEKTKNRMDILDGKIERESLQLFDIEQKKVLNDVLKKARTVIEREERAKGVERVKRYRDRRDNAEAIRKYRDKIKKDVDDLTSWVLKPNNKDILNHVPDALKNTVIPFLTSIDFTSKRHLSGGEKTKADKAFIKKLEDLRKAIKNNIDLYGMYSGYNDLPLDFMDKLEQFIELANNLVESPNNDLIINQMTAEELKDLSSIVKNLKTLIRKTNAFHINAMYQHVYEAGDNSIEFMRDLNPAKHTNSATNFLFWKQMKPAYAFERFGEGGIAIYDGLRRGQAKLAFNTKEIVKFAESVYTEKEVKAWEKELVKISLSSGTVKMTVAQMMGFYELSKQADSLRHILDGGIRVSTFKNGKTKISDNGHVLTPTDIDIIVNTLTDRQKEVADKLQQYMATKGAEWGNYVSVARFGEEQFGNPQYYPINSDGRHLQATADEHPSAAALYALLNLSFTKARNEEANNRIILYSIFDVFSNHMSSMAQYNAMALPILDALKWFNYSQAQIGSDGKKHTITTVREQMDRAFGVPEEKKPGSGKQGYAESFVINIIKSFNGTDAQGTPNDSMGLKNLHRYNRAMIAYNLRVAVQQPLAITRAGMIIDYKSILKCLKLKPSVIKQNIEEMQKHSGIAAWKSLGFYDVNISRGVTSLIKHDEKVFDKITDKGMWVAEKLDTLTWAAIWSACKVEVERKQHLKSTDKGYFEAVTKLFEEVIYKTQVVDSVLTKNEYMRDKGFFARAMSSFMSEPVTTASMLLNSYDKYQMDMQRGKSMKEAWAKNKGQIGRTVAVYSIGAILLAAAQAVIDAARDDDDYETYLEKYLEALGGNVVDELNPLNKLPFINDFVDLVKEFLGVTGVVDTYGNEPNFIYMQWWNSLINATEIIADNIKGEDTNYTWYGGIYKLLSAVSGMTGLPISALTREVVTAWNNIIGAFAPSLKVKDYDAGEKASIKYAYQDGYLTAEEATSLLLEKGLAKGENEAYFIIQEWDNKDKDYSKHDNLKNAMISGQGFEEAKQELLSHGYTEKEITSQIKSHIGKMFNDNEISTQKAIELLIEYGGLSSEEATSRIDYYQFKKDNPEIEGITESAYNKYVEVCEPKGISAETYYEVWKYKNEVGNDDSIKDKKRKVLDYIYCLNITTQQKRILISCWY